MDTTHPSNEEYDADRGAWAQRILDFAGAATFVDLTIFDEVEIDDDTLGQVYVRGSESLTIVSFEPGDDAAQAKAKADAEENTVRGDERRAKLAA